MTERIPPHNEEAEKSVLGAVMLSKDALFEAVQHVRAKDFYSRAHKEIFEAVLELYHRNSPVDTLTVSEELKRRNALEAVGGRAYIGALSSAVPTTSNAGEYAKIVAEKSALRLLIQAADDIIEKSYREKMDASQVIDFAERSIFEISQQRQTNDFSTLKDVLLENLKLIDKAAGTESGITGIPSGFIGLDEKTAGFQKSDLIVLAARPAMGKTAFALNIARQAAVKSGAKVLIFSMEMPKTQIGQRLLSIESGIELEKLKTGKLDQQQWLYQIQESMSRLSPANIYIDDTSGISIMEIKNKCRRLKAEKGLDMVIVDYLQLMDYEGKAESRQQEITALSRAFKQLAREMDCPVILLSQLSRAPDQRSGDKRPFLSDLRESGAIEQDADIVLFLYRDEYYNEDTEEKGICEVIISKHRSGPTGTVKLAWLEKYTKFGDTIKRAR